MCASHIQSKNHQIATHRKEQQSNSFSKKTDMAESERGGGGRGGMDPRAIPSTQLAEPGVREL